MNDSNFLQFWGLKVQDQGASMVTFWWQSSSCFTVVLPTWWKGGGALRGLSRHRRSPSRLDLASEFQVQVTSCLLSMSHRPLWTHPSCLTVSSHCVLTVSTRITLGSAFSPTARFVPTLTLWFLFPRSLKFCFCFQWEFRASSPLIAFLLWALNILLVANLSLHGEIFLECNTDHGSRL